MGLNVEEFLYSIDLPKSYFDADFDIKNRFKEEAKKYLELVDKLDVRFKNEKEQSKFETKLMDSKNIIEENIESINKIFRCYEESDLKNVQIEMDNLMDRLKEHIFLTSLNGKTRIHLPIEVFIHLRDTHPDRFYRIRKVEKRSVEIEKDKNQLFHLPFSKRAYSSNDRFSLSGFPSLYLSTSLQIAWQECKYPSSYYFSIYDWEKQERERSDTKINLLGLFSPNEIKLFGSSTKYNDFDLWLNIFIRYLIQYPLVLACSFVNHRGDAPFKQEYIIPQLLLQWVKRNHETVKGISYFSCVDSKLFNREWSGYNVVFPISDIDEQNKYSSELTKYFDWSDPEFYSITSSDFIEWNKYSKYLDHSIRKMKTFLNTLGNSYNLSDMNKVSGFVDEIITIYGCFYSLCKNKDSMDMELFLHVMNMIKKNIDKVKDEYSKLNKEINKRSPELCELLKKLLNDIKFFDYISTYVNECIHKVWKYSV